MMHLVFLNTVGLHLFSIVETLHAILLHFVILGDGEKARWYSRITLWSFCGVITQYLQYTDLFFFFYTYAYPCLRIIYWPVRPYVICVHFLRLCTWLHKMLEILTGDFRSQASIWCVMLSWVLFCQPQWALYPNLLPSILAVVFWPFLLDSFVFSCRWLHYIIVFFIHCTVLWWLCNSNLSCLTHLSHTSITCNPKSGKWTS